MNKKLLGAIVLSMTFGAALLPMTANAATEDSTGANIGFTTGPNTTIPGPYDNALSLVNRPTAFNFGKTNEISPVAQTYNQVLIGEQHVGVFEDRPDAEIGAWKVSAKMAPLVDKGGVALDSSISFNTEKISTFDIARDADGNLPTEIDTIDPLTDYTDTKVKGVKLVKLESTGASVDIMNAEADAGKGGFASQIRNVQLRINAGQEDEMTAGKAFTSAVTWTVSDTI